MAGEGLENERRKKLEGTGLPHLHPLGIAPAHPPSK